MAFDDIAWFPLSLGLTACGLVLAVGAARRHGWLAGARVTAWALVPFGLYLVGATQTVWRLGSTLTHFVTGFVFSPRVWLGVVVLGASAALFVTTGVVRRRALGHGETPPGTAVEPSGRTRGRRVEAKRDDDATAGFEDVEEILRRRGIG